MNRNVRILATLFSTVAFAVGAASAEPSPPELAAVTHVEVVSTNCKSHTSSLRRVRHPNLVLALVAEFSDLRLSFKGLYAAKISCSTKVTFYSRNHVVSTFHVFECSALELSSAPGKEYFEYNSGMNELPQLAGFLGRVKTPVCT